MERKIQRKTQRERDRELERERKIKQGRIVHRIAMENKIIYNINKGEKGLINNQIDSIYIQIDDRYIDRYNIFKQIERWIGR